LPVNSESQKDLNLKDSHIPTVTVHSQQSKKHKLFRKNGIVQKQFSFLLFKPFPKICIYTPITPIEKILPAPFYQN